MTEPTTSLEARNLTLRGRTQTLDVRVTRV